MLIYLGSCCNEYKLHYHLMNGGKIHIMGFFNAIYDMPSKKFIYVYQDNIRISRVKIIKTNIHNIAEMCGFLRNNILNSLLLEI